ncbi:MAG: histidine phosphatase family protein [Actinomycetia bacterium]|nr:histidine phosphatase family protein [Actinomycetes bacterium]MCP4959732.1 histidine phosphatase family protein [Actinomycetes bacterium]
MTREPTSFHQTRFQPPPGSTEILLVRHGASAPLVLGEEFPMLAGQGDPPLAPEGREQAERVGERLATESIDAIYVSSMQRTHETAAPLVARTGLEPIVEPDLREVHLGDWEGGLLRQKAAEMHPTYLAMRDQGRWDVIPNAETAEAFRLRTTAVIDRIAENHRDRLAVVVCHGGVIGALCAHATGGRPFSLGGSDNASISHLIITDEQWILRRFNDSTHLYASLSLRAGT